MAKVTITIDDTNEGIVAAFGPDSLNVIADAMGYSPLVPKTEAELPEKVETVQMVDGEETRPMVYPEGTEMDKPNPMSKAEFVGTRILENRIIPALLDRVAKNKKVAADELYRSEMAVANEVLKKAAVITAE